MGTDKLLTPEDAAKALVVKSSTVREWLRTGRLKGVKMGRLWRVRESDLGEFLKSLAQGPISPPGGPYLELGGGVTEVPPMVMGGEATIPGGIKKKD